MSVKLKTEQHLEFLSLKGGCTGSSEFTLVKMPHFWKSHAVAHLISTYTFCFIQGMHSYAERYGEMIEGIQSTFREADSFSGPHLDKMQKELEALVPMDKLQERRQWRDKRLAALTQLIKKFEDEEK